MASIRFLHGAATHYPEGDTLKKLVFGAIAAMLLVAPVADAKTSRATVVKRNAAAKTVVVANKAGTLRILHNRRDRVGTVLRINGSRIKAVGHARRVHIKGVVTRRSTKAFNLSASGAIVSVRSRGASRTVRRGGHSLGQGLNVTATISSNGTITETESIDTDNVDGAELKGTLTCTPTTGDPLICTQPDTLKIDVGPMGAPMLIPVMFDPVLFPETLLGPLVGQQVEARADLAPSADGNTVVLMLKAIDSEGMCQAQDAGGNVGDDGSSRHDGGGDGCEGDN